MNLEVFAPSQDLQPVLANLLELYQHDFTEFDDTDIGDDGRFGYRRLPDYWIDPARHPHLVRVDGQWAGFALVRLVSHMTGEHGVADMTEFFVMRKYRRKGVGRLVARQVFGLFPGPWEVRVMDTNIPAQAFWRRTIGEHTRGVFEERWSDDEQWRGLVLSFTSRGP